MFTSLDLKCGTVNPEPNSNRPYFPIQVSLGNKESFVKL